MTSLRQIAANRRNAAKSTGPRTPEGKLRVRQNAMRHGLTANTVVPAVEDRAEFAAFEAAIIANYNPQTAIEKTLVARLVSLLWRLRRATEIETGLFLFQAEMFRERRSEQRDYFSGGLRLLTHRLSQFEAKSCSDAGSSDPAPTSEIATVFLRMIPNREQ